MRSNGSLPSHSVNISGIDGREDDLSQHLALPWFRNVQFHDVDAFKVFLCIPPQTVGGNVVTV